MRVLVAIVASHSQIISTMSSGWENMTAGLYAIIKITTT